MFFLTFYVFGSNPSKTNLQQCYGVEGISQHWFEVTYIHSPRLVSCVFGCVNFWHLLALFCSRGQGTHLQFAQTFYLCMFSGYHLQTQQVCMHVCDLIPSSTSDQISMILFTVLQSLITNIVHF